ncbi:MAG: radical SAM protein [Chloroflexi bacterium]|nr:radical SAM protein [Chloroflexota bacterium]
MEPEYIALYKSGELAHRARTLEARLRSCDICPRKCGVNRLESEKCFCHSGYLPIVAAACAHHGEEPAISGDKGSGTIFFGNCNLRCAYCQNHQISQNHRAQQSKQVDYKNLASYMLYLQNELGCHNINFVSPSHFVPQIVKALLEAVPMGLQIPLVYNTSSYDSVDTLESLDGIISVYLADLRYASNSWGWKLSRVSDYVERARDAIKEMYRQVGDLALDESGIAQKGLLVRHLILPNRLAGSRESLAWLVNEVSPAVTVSIMAQYYPAHRATRIPLISRRINEQEYEEVIGLLDELGIENGWVQEVDASDTYQPDFARRGHPFEPAMSRHK